MRKEELQFEYPEDLVATEPRRPSRVMWASPSPREISLDDLVEKFERGDLLVINETHVLKRRVFAGEREILFLREVSPRVWEVLFPSRDVKIGQSLELPEGRQMKLLEKGRPQRVEIDADLDAGYFERQGEVPLPPYIQKARGARHAQAQDDSWYQIFWARQAGSLAAPTASLHFTPAHFERLRSRGVRIEPVTLHVGLGTFLPVTADDLRDHVMHFEDVEIPSATWAAVLEVRLAGGRVWALGTTVARTLESATAGKLLPGSAGLAFKGSTDLFITPGFQWRVVDRLLTNFHQPESTLLALVASFAGLSKVRAAYQWAIENRFRLFSYGDLSVWSK